MKSSMSACFMLVTLLFVGCEQSRSPTGPDAPSPEISSQPPVNGPMWQKVATGNDIDVYFEIFYACNCPNYARTLLFWDRDNGFELGRVEFTLADGWWLNYIRPEQDFQVTPDGTRLGVRFQKSGRFYDQYRIYHMRAARELQRITRSRRYKPFIIDDQNGATTGISLGHASVTLSLLIPTTWSETGDPEDPDVYGSFYPDPVEETFPIHLAN